jgi:predicted hydrocarbon binding protein
MLSEFLKRLMFGRQFSMDEGKIKIMGSRHLMFPSRVMAAFGQMDRKGTYLAAKEGIIEELNKSPSIIGIKNLHPEYSIVNFFDIMGIGSLSIVDLDTEGKKAVVRVYDREFSYTEADKFCDSFTAGVIAGIFSYIMSDSVDCKETACIAFGSEFCEFEIA